VVYISGYQPFWAHVPSLKKHAMDHFGMLTPHEQLVKGVLHIGDLTYLIEQLQFSIFTNVLWRIYGTLCESVEIPGGPRHPPGLRWEQVVYMDYAETDLLQTARIASPAADVRDAVLHELFGVNVVVALSQRPLRLGDHTTKLNARAASN